jgi:ectoine hydroxylase-related dioxygenase (phytanoyl-CoA dioxygenase family)
MRAVALPILDATHDLDPAAIESVRERGHCVVRGLATAEECASYLPEIQDGVDRWHPEPSPLADRDTYGKAFLQAMALRSVHKQTRGFVDSPRFAGVAAELLGVEGVRLYHDQALFKEAGGGRTPWHQDQNYWPLDTDDIVTMWMPLVDLDPAVGSMTFLDASHLDGDVGAGEISDSSDAAIERSIAVGNRSTTTHGALAAGDATFHKGWTIHSAGPNPTDATRPVMTIIWFADGARITEPNSPQQEFDLATWLDNGTPGTVAAGRRNPRLWPPS